MIILVPSTCFTHGPAFLDLQHFTPQLAWRFRRLKRFSILDNAVILYQLHHVHTQQQETPFVNVLLFLFPPFASTEFRHGPCSWTLMALMLLHHGLLS
ncbi:hypothetical protein M436DRAFT_45754 [Aureobasidium namibiae CBS 147.97]|uniref:Uncharacterized protein n=1 Tax=Aureobasidium namibiae CBS 147.97 TaxID=1043004 RepID=A0A074WVM8_9PEZI|nr:uncharacterized protein M436DRAFT_45754 [Aureobasidium namibiae CBS 147.97]KEQ73792.1 hypothetical protein M436DRAFT_45754 [Aureobasidium namibiae CBS 147.97]